MSEKKPVRVGPMEHVLSDSLEETGLGTLIGELGGNEGVDIFGGAGLVFGGKVNENVGMGEATLLKLDHE
jgi:hypothetical protein